MQEILPLTQVAAAVCIPADNWASKFFRPFDVQDAQLLFLLFLNSEMVSPAFISTVF